MALTAFQRDICRLIAANRAAQGEAYVAGGVALNTLLSAPRVSMDIDLFHDTREALEATWEADRRELAGNGYDVGVVRERPAYVEAVVSKSLGSVVMQWTCDSAFRFFPLVTHPDLGLTLHPFDLATNKVLALAGRREARDWVDAIECHRRVQRLGYLAWAACGKDPGLSPARILQEARRSSRYTAAELAELTFDGPTPDAVALARAWKEMLAEAEALLGLLPPEETGKCVLGADGGPFAGGPDRLKEALTTGALRFHRGSIRGAWPEFIG